MNVSEEIRQLSGFTEQRPFDCGLHGIGAEVGVCKGIHARAMLMRNPAIKRLYLIDPYKPRWTNNLPEHDTYAHRLNLLFAKFLLFPYRHKCIWLYATSSIVGVLGPLNFVYIDAAHDYQSVKTDIANCWSSVAKNGVMGGHDFYLADVGKAVSEFSDEKKIVVNRGNDWWIVKP